MVAMFVDFFQIIFNEHVSTCGKEDVAYTNFMDCMVMEF